MAMKVTGEAVQVKVGADALMRLKERFANWRAVRKLGMHIPPELWTAAVEMVAVHGACRVAVELNLDYDMLKRRVAQAGGKVTTTELAPRFVELFAAGGAMPAHSAQPECVVEMANTRGARMRVELNGCHGLGSLSALCNAFLGAP